MYLNFKAHLLLVTLIVTIALHSEILFMIV